MHVTAPAAIQPTDGPAAPDRVAAAPPDLDDEQSRLATDLHRLMDLADHYARWLVASNDSLPVVLLLAHHSDLEIVTLDGPYSDMRALPRLLAQRQGSIAALLVDADGSIEGRADPLFSIVGETIDGVREERHYRVRQCARRRRLTRMIDHHAQVVPSLAYRLFPPRTALDA